MNISCEVIKDLLPIYHDNVCSAESRKIVEEHIKGCSLCKNTLDTISSEFTLPVGAADEAKPIKAMQGFWKKAKKRAFVKGVAITMAICALLAGAYAINDQWHPIEVSPASLTVSEVRQLPDGRISFHLYVSGGREIRLIAFTRTETGAFYMTPRRSIFARRAYSNLGSHNAYLDFDEHMYNPEITALYVGPVGNGILVWERGMELPGTNE